MAAVRAGKSATAPTRPRSWPPGARAGSKPRLPPLTSSPWPAPGSTTRSLARTLSRSSNAWLQSPTRGFATAVRGRVHRARRQSRSRRS